MRFMLDLYSFQSYLIWFYLKLKNRKSKIDPGPVENLLRHAFYLIISILPYALWKSPTFLPRTNKSLIIKRYISRQNAYQGTEFGCFVYFAKIPFPCYVHLPLLSTIYHEILSWKYMLMKYFFLFCIRLKHSYTIIYTI